VPVVLIRTLPHDSYLHRRNPTVKFGVVFAISATLLAVFDPWTPALLYCLALGGVRIAGRIPWRSLIVAHVPFLLFGSSLFMVNAIARRGQVVWSWGPLDATGEGITVGASLALRTMVIGVAAIGFVLTTDGTRLMTSLHQHLRVSPRFTYAVLAGYRLLEQLPEEWQTIRMAQAVREERHRPGTLPRSPRALARAAFGLLVTALRRGERMAVALETRGLGSGARTIYRPVPLDRGDWLFASTVLAGFAMVLVTAWLFGWLRGPSALGVF
jgi:energy-coupling factor transporter transmembrane protein EcfT